MNQRPGPPAHMHTADKLSARAKKGRARQGSALVWINRAERPSGSTHTIQRYRFTTARSLANLQP
eukprot:1183996-Pleurochrysis_carterae.AAC.2